MSQTTLLMPCLPCVPDCIWPPNPSMGILFLPSALSNFVCNQCASFNQGAIVPFLTQLPTIPPTCVFESPLAPTCGAEHFRIATQFDTFGGGAIIVVTNGPFGITTISAVSLDCNWNSPWATFEGLT